MRRIATTSFTLEDNSHVRIMFAAVSPLILLAPDNIGLIISAVLVDYQGPTVFGLVASYAQSFIGWIALKRYQ